MPTGEGRIAKPILYVGRLGMSMDRGPVVGVSVESCGYFLCASIVSESGHWARIHRETSHVRDGHTQQDLPRLCREFPRVRNRNAQGSRQPSEPAARLSERGAWVPRATMSAT